MEASFWTFRARPHPFSDHPHGVVDGDTLDLLVDLGFSSYYRESFRLKGIDTAEVWGVSKDSKEYKRGKKHSSATLDFMETAVEDGPAPWPLAIRTQRTTGKYGRYLAREVVRLSDGQSLHDHLTALFPEVEE